MNQSQDWDAKSISGLASASISKQHSGKEIVSLDFSNDGTVLVTADSTMLNLYDTNSGKKIKSLLLKTKQIRVVRFTHSSQAVLCATHKNHQILYWSVHENQIHKIFKGHTDQIQCLEVSPKDDYFLTTSRDHTMKLWSLQAVHYGPQAQLNLSSKINCTYPVANFDSEGLIFVVAFTEVLGGNSCCRICLYDKAKFQQGAFVSWVKDYGEVRQLVFSKDGSQILCVTSDNMVAILDAYKGEQKFKLTGITNQNAMIECCFSPDSKFIASGSQDGRILIWDSEGRIKNQLKTHIEKCSLVRFSPSQFLFVSAGRSLIWWMPRAGM